jgi:hypothetical protein
MPRENEQNRPWWIGSNEWKKMHTDYPPTTSEDEGPNSFQDYSNQDLKKSIDDQDHLNEGFYAIKDYSDSGLKSSFIWTAMLIWAGTSVGLHLYVEHPEITIFSIKFLFFFFGGFIILSYVIGFLFFYLFVIILAKLFSPDIFYSFEMVPIVLKCRKFFQFIISITTFLIALYLFAAFYGY